MSGYTRLNPKTTYKTAADGKITYMIWGKIAVIQVYWQAFNFDGNWQDVVQLEGIVPADPTHGYFLAGAVTGKDSNVWLALTSTGLLRCRNSNATNGGSPQGIIGTIVVPLA